MKNAVIIGFFLVAPFIAQGNTDVFVTSELLSERPVFFTADGLGGFYGYTETGKTFTQRVITNDLNVRLHKFTIEDSFFYITDRGVYDALSDTQAISIYFSLG